VEAELYQYVVKKRRNGFRVLIEVSHFEGRRLAGKHSIAGSEFRVSCEWMRHFMARHGLTIRRRTTLVQRLAEAYGEKLVSLQKYAQKLREQ
jgi:hypothetical protein